MNSKQLIKSALLGAILGLFSFVIIFYRPSGALNADVLQPQENLGDVVVQPKKDSLTVNVKTVNQGATYEGLLFWDSTQADINFVDTKSDGSVVREDVGPGAKKFVVSGTKGNSLINLSVSGSAEMIVISDMKILIGNTSTPLSITNR